MWKWLWDHIANTFQSTFSSLTITCFGFLLYTLMYLQGLGDFRNWRFVQLFSAETCLIYPHGLMVWAQFLAISETFIKEYSRRIYAVRKFGIPWKSFSKPLNLVFIRGKSHQEIFPCRRLTSEVYRSRHGLWCPTVSNTCPRKIRFCFMKISTLKVQKYSYLWCYT